MADESEDIEASTASTAHSSSSSPQLLSVVPKDLYFPPPYTREVSAPITLTNTTSEPVTFKIKTTAPKRYIVRPPLGICPPGATIEVAVALAYHKDPPAHPEKGDKFQVQAFVLKSPPDSATQDVLKDIWRGKPAVTKTKIAAHFSERPANAPEVQHPSVTQTADEPSPTPKAAPEPVATIVNTSHAPKPRASEPVHVDSKPFDLVDPVSTSAPTASSQSLLIPLLLVLLLGLLLGFFFGMHWGSSGSAATAADSATQAAHAAAKAAAAATKAASKL